MMALRTMLLTGVLLASASVGANETATATITLKAIYTPTTCKVSGDNGETQVSVDFGVLAREPASWKRQPIPVKLDCNENVKTVYIAILGDAAESGNVKTEGAGDSVEIGLYMGPTQLEVGKSYKIDHREPLQIDAKPLPSGQAIPTKGGEFSAKAILQVTYE